ncbi:MAG: YHS domain-containing protein [Candidatus Nitrosopelagicus sp.]|jgi:YHS domain-containing protein|nr:YHS domain-containing protein [Thermoproteota archaeon]RMW37456.1 MAG: YHS domain-containing protein [Candidatus Nitrosopelagicus sp.]|tara:strand:+ start:781 stop:936 length:156 start_codon:yes stop_codon:yes gene_type:complete
MKVTDPVCGLEFDEDLSVTHEYKSKEYHFCCDGCKKIFIKKPKKWSKKSKQ